MNDDSDLCAVWDDDVLSAADAGRGCLEDPLASLLKIARNHAVGNPIGRESYLEERASSFYRDDLGTLRGEHVDDKDNVYWQPIRRFHLGSLNERFRSTLSRCLTHVLTLSELSGLSRRYLDNLLFHPLQNARDHGQNAKPLSEEMYTQDIGFAGIVVARNKNLPNVSQTTADAYLSYVEEKGWASSGFIDTIIFDDGAGIANHFSYFRDGPEELQREPVAREWSWLKNAFERHATSRYFRRMAELEAYQPGIGLAAMLGALRWLGGLAEIRTGRLHVWRYFRQDEEIARGELIWPSRPPDEGAARIRGTLVRLVIPAARLTVDG